MRAAGETGRGTDADGEDSVRRAGAGVVRRSHSCGGAVVGEIAAPGERWSVP